MARLLAIDIRLDTYLPYWDRVPLQFLLAVGPLIYFYVMKITRPDYKFRRQDLLHFSPLLIEQGVLLFEIIQAVKRGASTYTTPAFDKLNALLLLITSVSILIYLYRSQKLIENFYTRLQPVRMDRSRLEFRWLRHLFTGATLLCLIWLVYAIVGYFIFRSQLSIQLYFPFYIFFVIIIVWMAAAAILKSEANIATQPVAPVETDIPAELKAKGIWLKKEMENKLYYQDPDLTLTALSENLKISPRELSKIINVAFKKSFIDFINEYRVTDAARKIQNEDYDNMTLMGIGFEAGFNSKSSFNRVFKQMTGKSPTEYKKSQKNKRPNHVLGRFSPSDLLILNREPMKKWIPEKINSRYMFKNYFKTAFRSLSKNKFYTSINIIGLAVGLATCLLIFLYVVDELSYDKYNANTDRIYRVNNEIKFNGNYLDLAQVPAVMGSTMLREMPQVQQYVRMSGHGSFLVKKGDENVQEQRVGFADSTLFDVFTLPVIAGNAKTALKDYHSLVITETIAKKYFNSTDVVGKIMLMNDTSNYKITAVIKDIPKQSHFHFDFLVPMLENYGSTEDNWLSENYSTYILIKKHADVKQVEAQLNPFMDKHVGPQLQSMVNMSIDDLQKGGGYIRASLTPLADIHLHSNKQAELEANGNAEYVYIFSGIALMILLIACVNFMNLSTARSSNRAKEVGVRKVLGSLKKNLIQQFLTESFLISFIALVIAILVAWSLLPYFNQLAGKELNAATLLQPTMLLSLGALMLVVGLFAGSYPAFFLASFQPMDVLKGKLAGGFKRSWLRNSLVVFQFVISIVLIFGTIVIYNQLNYIHNKDIGFNRNQVVIINHTNTLGNQAESFKNELLQISGVQSATMSDFLPVNYTRNSNTFFTSSTLNPSTGITMQSWTVDENYIPTLDLKMSAGRNFSQQYLTDSTGVIINEAAAKFLATKDLLNKNLYTIKGAEMNGQDKFHIVGIVKNFNFSSLRDVVTPLALFLGKDNGSISVRINSTNLPNAVAQIKNKWQAIAPSQPFDYSFMDDDFNKLYTTEQRTGNIFITFAVLAILIACLGLFGLVTYAAEQRIREIGIRKVLGATVSNIAGMLSTDFLKLVIISAVIAFPLAWFAMNKWLQGFAYRITISWWVFVIAGVLALLIALITVSFQSIKAAIANPVKSLRTE